jgi:hypothetical protein
LTRIKAPFPIAGHGASTSWEIDRVPNLEVLVRNSAPVAGALALVSWAVALGDAAPRLLAGPLCTSSQDAWAFAGHCPACYVAAALTIMAVSLAMGGRLKRARVASASTASDSL